jgi:hypothetical protein
MSKTHFRYQSKFHYNLSFDIRRKLVQQLLVAGSKDQQQLVAGSKDRQQLEKVQRGQ